MPIAFSRHLKIRHVLPLLFLAAFAWVALRQPSSGDDPRLVQREFLAMGTLVTVTAYLDPSTAPARAAAAIGEVEKSLHGFEHTWSAWGDGELGRINRDLAAGKAIAVPAPMQELFAAAWDSARRSGGDFEPRIGALVRLWGFDDESHYRSEPPPPAEIERLTQALHAAPGYVAGRAYGPAPGVQWDFGAVAKGYAIEQAIAQLKAAGIGNAIVNAGGNLRAAGRHGDRPWKIGIRQPRPTGDDKVLAWLEASGDEAVLTSGDYERYFEYRGHRYCHILDPRTGRPADTLQSVTVVYPDATRADPAGTSLFVAGAAHWREAAAQLGLDQVLVVDAAGQAFVTPRLATRLRFSAGVTPHTVP